MTINKANARQYVIIVWGMKNRNIMMISKKKCEIERTAEEEKDEDTDSGEAAKKKMSIIE